MKVSSDGSFYSQSLGKYWQLNQSNQHTSTYSRIQQQTENPYYAMIHNEYAQENPRINWQGRQKIKFPGSAYPKISQQCTPATHTEAVHCQRVLLGVFHPCLWPLKAPGSTLGMVAKPLISPLMPVPPHGLIQPQTKGRHSFCFTVLSSMDSYHGLRWISHIYPEELAYLVFIHKEPICMVIFS